MSNRFQGVILFDLDGTLLDTAPEFLEIINAMKRDRGERELRFDELRPHVSNGARGMITASFQVQDTDPAHDLLREDLLARYARTLGQHSRLFDGLAEVLDALDRAAVGWGVVTNKPSTFTLPLLENLNLLQRCAAVTCPDEVGRPKPDPASLLLACERAGASPSASVYVGDHLRDIEAGQRADMRTVAAAWGYIPAQENPHDWSADFVACTPAELLAWLASEGVPLTRADGERGSAQFS